MALVLRKIITSFLNPLPILIILISVAFTRRHKRLGLTLCAALYLAGTTPVADLFIRPLEERYPIPNPSPEIKHVVVLTGDMFTRKTPLSSSGCSSTQRLLTAAFLCKRLKACTLILSGGSLFGKTPGAFVWGNILDQLGNFTYIAESRSRTTEENARFALSIVGDKPFYLVTSAYHMPRSVMLFKSLGGKPIPYPADFLAEDGYNLTDFFPQGRNIRKIELAMHEYLGLAYYSLIKRLFHQR